MGQVDVDGLLASLSSRQISEWMAYFSIEPFGEERADLRMATLAALIANINRDEKKRSSPYTPDDFMPKFEGRAPVQHQTWEDQKAIFKALSERRLP